jgi:hypothetical protein
VIPGPDDGWRRVVESDERFSASVLCGALSTSTTGSSYRAPLPGLVSRGLVIAFDIYSGGQTPSPTAPKPAKRGLTDATNP